MGKFYFSIKKNNKGVSLVEVLVTIAMVIILAGPLINSFLNSRGINSNARVIQNGTIVAQDMAEKFCGLTIDQLCETTAYGSYLDTDAMTTRSGVYIFKDIAVTGANNEKFYVDITLDSNTYAVEGGEKLHLNNASLPGMTSLYSSDAIMLYKHYVAVDEKLRELFGSTGLDSTTVNRLHEAAYRKKITKKTLVDISCTYNSTLRKYDYDIVMTMTYNYNGTHQAIEERRIEDMMLPASVDQNIYLVCPIFDIYTKSHIVSGTSGDISYCTDAIDIKYRYTGATDARKEVNFYLVEQNVPCKERPTAQQSIKLSNVKINDVDLTRSDALAAIGDIKFKLHTNIFGASTVADGLTETGKTSGIALYDMNVKVKHKGEVVADFSTSK